MEEEIVKLLHELEVEDKVKVLFAVESGSREWGFASDDSDYDVRGVTVGRLDSYLGLTPPPQQLELKRIVKGHMIDIVTWDIKKFANLLLKSNPTVSEWLVSNTTYIDEYAPVPMASTKNMFQAIFQTGFSPSALKLHYLHLAKQNYYKYIKNTEFVNLKKYVYVLRALACYLYLEDKCRDSRKVIPPLPYYETLPWLSLRMQQVMEKFVEEKKESEDYVGRSMPEINVMIEVMTEIKVPNEKDTFDFTLLNSLVRNLIWKYNETIKFK